jgi:hypothetical protein
VDYLVSRVQSETDFQTSIETFVVNQARLDGVPTLTLTSPVARTFKFNTDFSLREGNGSVSGPVAYLQNGGCGLVAGSLSGKIALFEMVARPCG